MKKEEEMKQRDENAAPTKNCVHLYAKPVLCLYPIQMTKYISDLELFKFCMVERQFLVFKQLVCNHQSLHLKMLFLNSTVNFN